jgi:hypothetical protein
MSRLFFVSGVAALALAIAAPAAAQSPSYGIRAGVSGDPDQFVFGGHLETDPLIDRLSFRPNVEIGVGDDITLFAVNLEFAYSIPLEDQPWRVYFGGGPALNLYSFGDDHPGRGDDTELEGGFNVMVGLQHTGGLFTEFKVGAVDSPDIKFVVGYAFR